MRDLGFTTRAWPCLTAGSGDVAEEVARLQADLERLRMLYSSSGTAQPCR